MKDTEKTREQLIDELAEMRQRVAELEALTTEHRWAEEHDETILRTAMDGSWVIDTQGHRGVALSHGDAALEALRRERDFAESLVDTAQAIVLVLDTEGRIVRFNPYMEHISGYRLEEVQGKDWFSTFLPERDHKRIRELFREAVADIQTRGNVNPIVTKDGRERHIEWYDKTLKNVEGNVIGLLAIGQDITERVQAREAIEERLCFETLLSELSAAFINLPTGQVDQEIARWLECIVEFLEVDRSAVLEFSEDKKELQVTHSYAVPGIELITGITVSEKLPWYTERLRRGQVLTLERLPDDLPEEAIHERQYFVREGIKSDLSIPLAAGGSLLGAVGIGSFRTQRRWPDELVQRLRLVGEIFASTLVRKRAEEEREQLLTQIQVQAQQMRRIMDTVPEGVLLLDAQGQVILTNPMAEEHLLALADAQVGDTLTHLGDCALPELLAPPPDGLWHDVPANDRSFEIIARPLEARHRPEGWVLVARDVTRERAIQQRIQRQERLAVVGQLAAGIAHDFNNLLTAIIGFAQLMGNELSPDDPLQESLGKVLDSGRRAANLVRQLLAFSRKQVIQPQVLDLNHVVADMDKMLRRIIGEDVQLKSNPAPDLWPVKVDPTQIEQVIVNLVVNARDAMPEGGRLIIETANVVLSEPYGDGQTEMEPGEHVLLAVSDTGIGMRSEVQARIFEPFFTTKKRGRGTGLGLSTVYGIVKQSGGHIEVYSEKGIGTTFKVYLPQARGATAAAADQGRAINMPAGDETILLVEDDEGVRDLARLVLQGLWDTLYWKQETARRHCGWRQDLPTPSTCC